MFFIMQGKNTELAQTWKNFFWFSMCLVLIVALLMGLRIMVKELFLLYILSSVHFSFCVMGINKGYSNCIGV